MQADAVYLVGGLVRPLAVVLGPELRWGGQRHEVLEVLFFRA